MTAIFLTFALAVLSAFPAFADYRLDDLLGPSGLSTQWITINDAGDTLGGPHDTPVWISSDILSAGTNAVLNVINGSSDNTVNDRNLQTMLLILTEGEGGFDIGMRSEPMEADVSTPDVGLNTIVNEYQTPYVGNKEADNSKSPPTGASAAWRNFHFNIARQNDRNKYDTVIQSLMFQQNPANSPSQSITRPIVISNVHSGTAALTNAPLIVRMTLRDTPTVNGNIIAYDRAAWSMTDNLTTGGNQWVFIPVDDLNTDNKRIEYYLTTEIANNTAYRYAARYYDSTGGTLPAYYWKFDIMRPQGTTNIPREIVLANESQIAPGLITGFQRRYNINETNKTPIHIFPVDTPDYGDYGLTLNHKIIFGKNLGDYQYPASEGRFNLFEVTAFEPKLASTTFYDDVADITNSSGTVTPPTNSVFSSSSVKREVIADDVLEYFTVSQNIPSSARSGGAEGILPLHITMNIPVTRISDNNWWNNLLSVWRNTGRVEDMFANNYELYLRAGNNNVWNLTQELSDKGYYNDLVKVFVDENRGRLTQDNYSGLLTVSFIVMLMDGTRDGVRPELSIVRDNSVSQENRYIVIRDGVLDNKWEMTFFIAPTGWQDNPTHSNGNNNTTTSRDRSSSGTSSGGGGGGGCASGVGVAALGLWALMIAKRERRG